MSEEGPAQVRLDCELERLILRVNDHPDARLKLLAEVSEALEDCTSLQRDQQSQLIEKVERWRYQLLNHNAGRLTEDQRQLTERLDLLMNQLGGEPTRTPRRLRSYLETALSGPEPRELADCLDPSRPLESVEAAAREVSESRFAHAETRKRSMLLYAPLYLSNYCINYCLYCGFRYPNAMARDQLDVAQAVEEAESLGRHGFRHILLVAGEFPRLVTVDYLREIVAALTERGFVVSVEVAPQSTLGYYQLRRAGAVGVTLYQETYDPATYARLHPKGTKAWYDWRLEGPERAAEAGIRRVGLGVLLGLAEPRREVRALIAHARYLTERFPRLSLSLSLPRIHEAPEGFTPAHRVDGEEFIRLHAALRKAIPGANLVLSTREPASLRDRLASCCITQMSAGSSTSPGGYRQREEAGESLQQFPVVDQRTPELVLEQLRSRGFEVVWTPEALDPHFEFEAHS